MLERLLLGGEDRDFTDDAIGLIVGILTVALSAVLFFIMCLIGKVLYEIEENN